MADVADKPVAEVQEAGEENNKAAEESETAQVKEVTDAAANAGDEECVSRKEKQIIHQIEYYFGDANLNRDKFLLEQISKDEEGWVPITVLLTFKRLAQISTDAALIAESLKKSDNGLVEVNADNDKIRRHPERPLPEHNEERRKEIMSRTAYVKGFPLDSSIDALLEFFAGFDKVVHINMRKYLDKPSKSYKFKGSVFVTFETKEQAEAFIEKSEASIIKLS